MQSLAQKGYEQWSNATPLERLAMKAPADKKLGEGKYARLNSRAASMILASLNPAVRADLVMRRSTHSTAQIVYSLQDPDFVPTGRGNGEEAGVGSAAIESAVGDNARRFGGQFGGSVQDLAGENDTEVGHEADA